MGAPLLIALCLLSGPFQVPDEPAHFLRAVQISHGAVLPVAGPDGHSAGGLVDWPAIVMIGEVVGKLREPSADRRAVLAGFLADGQRDGSLAYVAFSNTVIYFPLAYLVPAVAIAAARQAGLPPLAWLYAGRLANAGVALLVSAFAIALFEEAAIYALVVCLLPRGLFEQASLSADGLVIAFAMLFWALLAGFGARARATRHVLPGFFLAMLYVCVGKIAYIPLAVLPPVVAIIERRHAPPVAALAAASVLVSGCWLGWSLMVQNDVFPIGHKIGVADPHQQLRAVLRDPTRFFDALAGSFRFSELRLFLGMDGPIVGWHHDVTLPAPVVALSLLTLIAAAVFRRRGPKLRRPARAAAGLAVLACIVAIYFLLYLDFTPVGGERVDGMEGRYLIPLLGSAPILLAGVPRPGRWRATCEYALVGGSVFAGLWLVVMVWRGYWLGS